MMLTDDLKPLIDYESLKTDVALSVPTPDHYRPLLYNLGAGRLVESIHLPVNGVDGESIP